MDKMDNNGQQWTIMDNNGQQWTTMANNGQQWATMGSNRYHWATMDNIGQSAVLHASLTQFVRQPASPSPLPGW